MNELKYVIEITDATGYRYYIGNGGSYQFQGEKYAVVVERAGEAKKYKSYSIACSAYEKLFKSCCNVQGNMKIIGIDESGDLHYVE
jgi:hypothetical protein